MSKAIIKDEQFNDLLSYVEARANEVESVSPVENCKLCQSKFKAEAHKEYDRTKNINAVLRLVLAKGEDISYPAISNHINNHYKAIQEHDNIVQLAKRLQKWKSLSSADDAMYTRYIQMLDMEAVTLMAENNNLDLIERRKNTETFLKITQSILQFKEMKHKLELEKRPVEIFVDSLNRIISVKLEDCKNAEVRQALKEVMDQLAKDVDAANPTAGLKEEK